MNAREWSLRIADLARREHCALVDLLLALAEFDRLGVYRQLGFPSLFDYLHREVGLSRGSACYRQVATRLLRDFPEIAEPLRDGGSASRTSPQLAKVMTEQNRATVMQKFFHRSNQEAKQVVAEMLPAEVVPRRTVVTEVPFVATARVQPVERNLTHPEGVRPVTEVRRTVVEPLTRDETRMHVTVSPAFMALLKKARAGQSHVQPRATDEQVLTAALELLIEKQGKRKASVPAKVKREVRKRDEGKCQWKLDSGGVCGSEVRTGIDHVVPRGKGGPSTVENCRVLCKVHNIEAARQAYGDAHMDLFTPRAPSAREEVAPYLTASAIPPLSGLAQLVGSRPSNCSGTSTSAPSAGAPAARAANPPAAMQEWGAAWRTISMASRAGGRWSMVETAIPTSAGFRSTQATASWTAGVSAPSISTAYPSSSSRFAAMSSPTVWYSPGAEASTA